MIKFDSDSHSLNKIECIFYSEQRLKVTARIQTISKVHRHTVARMVSVLCAAEVNYICPVLFSSVLLFHEVAVTKVQRILLLEQNDNNPNTGCVYNVYYSVDFSDKYWCFKKSWMTA